MGTNTTNATNMTYAQILNGIVVNCIVISDPTLLPAFAVGFDSIPVRIDNITDASGNAIGIGWAYANAAFTAPVPPPPPVLTPQQMAENEVQACIDFFNSMMIQYAAQNILLGITAAGATSLIADTLATVQQYGESGSLIAAITALQAITLTPQMSPYLTTAVVASLVAETQAFLATL